MAIMQLAFAFMAGTTVSGTAGSLMELAADLPLSFSKPFFTRSRPVRSIAAVILAGPMMFMNDSLAARRQNKISLMSFAFCASTAVLWSSCLGIVVVGLAWWMLTPLP